MTRVLVTGGSGFLGSSVVKALAADHSIEHVISADIRAPRSRDAEAEYIELDVTQADSVDGAVADNDVDVIVHLASIVTPPPGMADEVAYRVDVDGTRHVVEAALAHGVGRIIVTSSGAAYGYHADNPIPLTEDDPLRGNDAFVYSRHKRLVEQYLQQVRDSHPNLEQTILRVGTILGESVDNQITALFERKRLLKIAGAESPFVFIWDTDVTAIIVRAITSGQSGIYNVAGDGTLTVGDIAQRMDARTITVPEPVLRLALAVLHRLGLSPYGPEQTKFLQFRPVLDNTRLKNEFGYTPEFSSVQAFEKWRQAKRGTATGGVS